MILMFVMAPHRSRQWSLIFFGGLVKDSAAENFGIYATFSQTGTHLCAFCPYFLEFHREA